MAIITILVSQEDRSEGRKGGFGTKPEGQYRLRVESKEWAPAKAADKYPTLVLKCKVLQSFNGQNLDKTITRRFNMHPKSIPYNLARFLQAGGIAYQYTPQGAIQFDDDHVLGVTTDVTCKHTKGDQRTFEEWENDAPIGPTQQVTPQAPDAAATSRRRRRWTPPAQPQQFVPQQPRQYAGLPGLGAASSRCRPQQHSRRRATRRPQPQQPRNGRQRVVAGSPRSPATAAAPGRAGPCAPRERLIRERERRWP
jgi:hypothetical protein